jgi:hypothetical protein
MRLIRRVFSNLTLPPYQNGIGSRVILLRNQTMGSSAVDMVNLSMRFCSRVEQFCPSPYAPHSMALNQLIQFLSLAIVVSKTIPLAGSSIEGGLSAVLEICKIAQVRPRHPYIHPGFSNSRLYKDVKTHKKECVQLAEQASSFAVEVMGRFDQEDLPPMPELEKIAKQFVS